MKISRKLIAGFMTMTMLFTAAACGGTDSKDTANGDTAGDETTGSKSAAGNGDVIEIEFVQGKREAGETYDKVIAAFEAKNPGIKIKQNLVPDADQVLMTRASSDNLPDIFNHWPTNAQFIQFENEGLLLDLSDKDYLSTVNSTYLDSLKTDKGLFMIPYNLNFMGLYYNVDKFEEAGFKPPTTWQELIDIAEKIKEKGETAFVLPGKETWVISQLWGNIESKDLGDHKDIYAKMNKGEADFTTYPEYKTSLEKMVQLMDYASEDSLALGYEQGINEFATGKAWMFPQGSWALPAILKSNPDMNVAMTMMPNDAGDMKAVIAPDTGLCVNAKMKDDPKKMEAIDKFLAFCVSEEGAQIYTDNDKSPSCVDGISFDVPQFKEFFDYVDAHGSVSDAAPTPTGFEDTKRSKLQGVLLGGGIDAFLKELSADYKDSLSAN
ncbi:ABC transporter substrate-binding protein [Novisyntrophococcus fermenticellae]|uniref:ABC transporter substrate-binding protein n=1 Tax=Novisyntrophococcus fermenticellae TaxID=2068655 RepID=UPI001E4C6044|nr:extracellular solute-binding protein [Novisyntrophococcus fermenticellae]